MPDWRDYILRHFATPTHRLTLVADPDDLLLEERILADLHQRGFQLLQFTDPVLFRYAYESQFRQKWDRGESTELVVTLRTAQHALDELPYDLLNTGRQLRFRLPDLFPGLSYKFVRELDRVDLDRLYAVRQSFQEEVLGEQATCAYLLRQVFDVDVRAIRTPADLLKHLLARHHSGRRVPALLDKFLVQRLKSLPGLESWPLLELLNDRSVFFAFLQRAWPRFLADYVAHSTGVHELPIAYTLDTPLLPLDDPEIRIFVDSLFLEGYLRPISVPDEWKRGSWMEVGMVRQPEIDRQLRFERLFKSTQEVMPSSTAAHQDWLQFARIWAEAVALRHSLPPDSPLPAAVGFAQQQSKIESGFAAWMQNRYLTLHNYPPVPAPVMLHHVPQYLASRLNDHSIRRVALVVIDGLALSQWQLVEAHLKSGADGWAFRNHYVFAWVPTLTPVSRQSLFAALPPLDFPQTWNRTDRDEQHWKRFWKDHGLADGSVHYFIGTNLDNDAELDAWLADSRAVAAGLVVKQVDEIMHGMRLGGLGMHQQVELWLKQGHLARLLAKLSAAGFTAFVTADHGNVVARGIGRPIQGSIIDERGQRALQFQQEAFLAQALTQYPTAIPWRSDALPDTVHVLLADGLNAFADLDEEIVCHGGIALEEVIVPFVEVTSVPT